MAKILTTDHFLETARGRLLVRRWAGEAASGPSIILFHDSLGSVELWRDFPARLAEATGLPVLAYDRLGFGRSDPNPDKLGLDFMADEGREAIPALLKEYGIERFIAFGHSVGGAMATATAGVRPDACLGVVTESAQAFVEDRTLEGIRAAEINFADPAQVARLAKYHGDKSRWVVDAWILTWTDSEFRDWSLDDHLARLKCPLLALHGDQDEFGSEAHPRRIAGQAAAGGELAPIDNRGRVPHREKAEVALERVVAFVRALPI